MNEIFSDIEDLKKVVKVNTSLPWESIQPFINDARDIYLERYIGTNLLTKAYTEKDESLISYIKRAVGPLTMMLAASELGIMIGDSGITVQNEQGKRSPANEAKITAAVDSFCFRGFQAIDRLLQYLEDHASNYPEWEESQYCTIKKSAFITTAREYQDKGLIDIDYSILTFQALFSTLLQLQERNLRELFGRELYKNLLDKKNTTALSEVESELIEYIMRFLANKTAELHTSKTTKEQRIRTGSPEFKPVIRPVYSDLTDTGNFFADQANYYYGKISELLTTHAEELGIKKNATSLNFNSKKNKLFIDFG